MTHPIAPSEHSLGSSDAGATAVDGRRTVGRWAVVTLIIALAAAGLTYLHLTHAAADEVVLRWRQSPPDCEGAKIRPSSDQVFGSMTPAAVVVTDDFKCTIFVEILNKSDRSIHLDHAVARGVGADTGTIIAVDPAVHPQSSHRDDLGADQFGFDAYVEISGDEGVDLQAGQSTAFTIDLVFNPQGCNQGATTWIDGWPEVTFSVWGREFTRPAANTLAVFHRGLTSGCQRG